MVAVRRSDAVGAEAAGSSALLRAVVDGDAAGAREAAAVLLRAGADPRRVYRTVARTLLPRAVEPARGGWSHGLFALNAALFLVNALPESGRAGALAHAVRLAVEDWPARESIPHALPDAELSQREDGWSSAGLAERVCAAALAGDAAGAEWALALLLAGPHGGSQPGEGVRAAAYGAILGAAARAELEAPAWGHLLVTGQHAVEMAELLAPWQTLLALRPALWAVARAVQEHRNGSRTGPSLEPRLAPVRCALRINRRPARPGETVQWAIAFRTRPTLEVVEEALASGLEGAALLDAGVLAVAGGMAALAARRATSSAAEAHARRFAALGTHVVLALHAARRATDLVDSHTDAVQAALGCLERLARLTGPWPSPGKAAYPLATPAEIAGAAVTAGTPHALALGEAALAEYEERRTRNPEYVDALMRAAGLWLRRQR